MRRPRYGDIFAGHDDGAEMAEMAKVLWEEYKADMVARKLWSNPRGRILDRLVRAKTEYLHYYPQAVSEGPVRLSGDGGQYVNMLWSQVQKLDDKIQKLERSLTMTPESTGEKKSPVNSSASETAADEFLSAH